MQDSKGNKVSFKNCIIVFTTNLGCDKDTNKLTGMGLIQTKSGESKSHFMKAIEDYFRPEFLGRLDDIVFFNHLSNDIAAELIERYKKEYEEKSGLTFTLDDNDIAEIEKAANIEVAGARGLRKEVKKYLVKKEIEKDDEVVDTSSSN